MRLISLSLLIGLIFTNEASSSDEMKEGDQRALKSIERSSDQKKPGNPKLLNSIHSASSSFSQICNSMSGQADKRRAEDCYIFDYGTFDTDKQLADLKKSIERQREIEAEK